MEGIDDKGNNPSDPLNRVMKHGLDFLSLTKDERFSIVDPKNRLVAKLHCAG